MPGRQVLIKLPAEVSENDAYTVFKSMRNTLKAEKVEMETIEQKKGEDGKRIGPMKCRVTGYFWADVVLDMEEEIADAQGHN